MKIIKLSDKQFYKLQEFIEKECDYVSEIASEYIDSEIGNELISSLDSMQDMASEVPVIGGMLGKLSEGGFNTLKDKVGGIVESFQLPLLLLFHQ